MATQQPSGRKVMVLGDNSLSTRAAVAWAAHWSLRTNDEIVLFHVIVPDQAMGFGVMQNIMRAEQHQAAQRMLDTFSGYAERLTGRAPQWLIKEGPLKETVRDTLKDEPDLSLLVLSASHRETGPAPLIGYLSSRMGSRVQVPLVLVPGTLTAEQIDAMT